MMNLKEKFGCDECKGEGHKIIRPFDSFGNEKEWCSSCSGTGYSNGKILAYVKEQSLENAVAGVELMNRMGWNPNIGITYGAEDIFCKDNAWLLGDKEGYHEVFAIIQVIYLTIKRKTLVAFPKPAHG